jgi:hypothetical protein
LEERRQRLEKQIETFQNKVDVMMEGFNCDDVELENFNDEEAEVNSNEDVGDEDQWESDEEVSRPEEITLFLPSSLSRADLERLGLTDIAKQELELRKGQANDALEGLRLALGHKSLLFRTDVSVIFSEKDSTIKCDIRSEVLKPPLEEREPGKM